MAVSSRTRFEIFKRDGFRCAYCGANPLSATLVTMHVDHVNPKAAGGSDDPSNLITACETCNLGKSNVPLEQKKYRSEFASEAEKEHAEQIREYLRVQRDIVDAKKEVEATVLEHWEERIGEWHWSLPKYIPSALKEFGLQKTIEVIDILARKRIRSELEQVKYFCGVLRRWRTGGKPDQPAAVTPAAIRDAKWEVAIHYITEYCGYRFGFEIQRKLDDLLKSALGSTPEKEAPLSITDVFRAADMACWLESTDDKDEDFQEKKFRHFIELAITDGDEAIPDEYFAHETWEQHRRSMAFSKAAECCAFWRSWYETEPPRELQSTLADILDEVSIHAALVTMRDIRDEVKGKEPAEQLSLLRNKYVDLFYGYEDLLPQALIRQWPEFKELEKLARE